MESLKRLGRRSVWLLAGIAAWTSNGELQACPFSGYCTCGPTMCGCGEGCSCNWSEAPLDGPIWTRAGGNEPAIDFPRLNVRLLSWIPITQFDASFTKASTCEGYVSSSGREYAIIGLSGGTGFVEVTNPAAATIVQVVPDCAACTSSTWRDIKVYSHYAYIVSEAENSGIMVVDLAAIDNGTVTVVNTITTEGTGRTHTNEINKASGYLYRCGGGGTLGLRIYTLADPTTPALVATTTTTRYFHECQAVSYNSGPYAGKEIVFGFTETSSGGGVPGVTILDVTEKQAIITLTANYQYSTPSFSHQGWLSKDRQHLYINDETDSNPNTRVINVSNLSSVSQVGAFSSGVSAVDHNLYTLGKLIFESNYRSGLQIFDASNPTAPVRMAFFDTYETSDDTGYNGLWDNYPFLPSGIVLGSDIEKGLFVWCVGKDGDMNKDFLVNDLDIPILVSELLDDSALTQNCGADVNGDGVMDGADIAAFDAAYLAGP